MLRHDEKERLCGAASRIVGRLLGIAAIVASLNGIAHAQGTSLGAVCLSPDDAAARADSRGECLQAAADAGFQTGALEPCGVLGDGTFDCGGESHTCAGVDGAWVCEGHGGAASGSNVEAAGSGVCAYCPQGYHCHCTPSTGTCACYIKQPKPR